MGNDGKKRELPVLFWPKTGVSEYESGRECCWPYLIDQEGLDASIFFFTHPFSPVFGQKQPSALDYCYFAQLPPGFGHFMFSSGGILDRTDQTGHKNN